ncbi:MAG: hypothetical protein K2N69_03475 [Helicobacter sp.]|nr:hypothetical protein [Helicobacter sp.]
MRHILLFLVFLNMGNQDCLLLALLLLLTTQKHMVIKLLCAALLSTQLATSLPTGVVAEPQVFPLIAQVI